MPSLIVAARSRQIERTRAHYRCYATTGVRVWLQFSPKLSSTTMVLMGGDATATPPSNPGGRPFTIQVRIPTGGPPLSKVELFRVGADAVELAQQWTASGTIFTITWTDDVQTAGRANQDLAYYVRVTTNNDSEPDQRIVNPATGLATYSSSWSERAWSSPIWARYRRS